MNSEHTLSGLNPQAFEMNVEGAKTHLYTLRNAAGTEVAITNYGAKIVSLMVADRTGRMTDVVLGHNTIEEYLHSEEPYFGAICGRYANRIARGRFTLDSVTYDRLAINNGPNALHGGLRGFNAVVWDARKVDDCTLELRYISADGEEGYPGELSTTVTYHLTQDNAVEIGYHAVTTKPTVLNLTNHSYFNLSGAGDPSIADHTLEINADAYLPTDETAIPYGPAARVADTPFDFRIPHTVGARIGDDDEQLRFGRGYDHTYILNKQGEELSFAARTSSPKTGIVMEVYTTQPGVQLYTGNWMTGNFAGKMGHHYPMRSALCLETQHYPDAPNHADYPTTVLRPGEEFRHRTIFKFSQIK